jgi:Rieske Fe-S protein
LITYPVGITINPSTEKVYVANEFSNTVSVIDIPTLKVEKPTDQSKQENDKKSSTKGKKKIASIENLKEGQGIVLEEKKITAYKDYRGQLDTYSAVCTHLGCTVTWNNSEKSFDCPCHGSRFSPSGNVINGPANTALEHKQVQ